MLEAVPADHLDYRPDAKTKTGLGLVRHIPLEDEWLLTCVADGVFVPPPDDWDACRIMNAGDAVARYKQKVPAALERVRGMSGEQLHTCPRRGAGGLGQVTHHDRSKSVG